MSDGAVTDPSLNRVEHLDENISAKRVAPYYWDGSNWVRQGPGASGKATGAYSISAISATTLYKYFWFEDADLNYYIMRKTLATKLFDYTKGTGGYQSVYVSATAGPSGSPTFGTYGATF